MTAPESSEPPADSRHAALEPAPPSSARRIQILAGLVFTAVVVIVFAVVLQSGKDVQQGAGAAPQNPAIGISETDALLKGIPQDGLTLGDPKAPVTVVEFVDLQCPFCALQENNEQPKVIKELVRTGKAKLRVVPLAFLGTDSEVGRTVLLRLAARDLGWNFLNLQFLNQGPENTGYMDQAYLEKLLAGIPGATAADAARTEEPAVAAERKRAQELGMALLPDGPSTPSFFVGPSDADPTTYEKVDVGARPHAADAIIAAVGDVDQAQHGGTNAVTATGPRPALTVGLQTPCDAAPSGASSCDAAHRRSPLQHPAPPAFQPPRETQTRWPPAQRKSPRRASSASRHRPPRQPPPSATATSRSSAASSSRRSPSW